jgi:hypothetical protein
MARVRHYTARPLQQWAKMSTGWTQAFCAIGRASMPTSSQTSTRRVRAPRGGNHPARTAVAAARRQWPPFAGSPSPRDYFPEVPAFCSSAGRP